MTQPFKAACIQVNASNDMDANIRTVSELLYKARFEGAQMAFLPENVVMMEWGKANITAKAQREADHPGLAALRQVARDTHLWLHGGTLAIKLPGEERIANRTYVINPQGEIAATYDKIHMFDVDLGNGEAYRESSTFKPGERAVAVATPWGKLGLSVCYDLRFPHLYRTLAKSGADFLAIPAAFTRTTGRAHWHVLLRARAIETGCFVFAPAQCGEHVNNRQTYGHSLIVAPWGEVLADAGEQPGYVVAEIDPAKVAEARGKVPSLQHDRPFGLDVPL